MAPMAQYPYDNYRLYVVLHKKEGRRMANLVQPGSKKRTTISYARYLMSVHLSRELNYDEHVDHVNNNKLDDRIENYQILSQQENSLKNQEFMRKDPLKFQCPKCKIEFLRTRQRAYSFLKTGKIPFCSRKCAASK